MEQFTASDGARLAYADEGSGRPLLLLHGLMANADFFRFQRPLASQFRLISLDLRGHGRSDCRTPGVDRMAADVTELIEALDLRDVLGVGWSLGAAVLWQVLTGRGGNRFAASVSVDMTPRIRNGGGWALGLSPVLVSSRTAAIRTDFPAFAEAAGRAILSRADEMADVAAWSSRQFALSDADAIASAWRSLADEDLRPRLPQIEQPALIVHGAHSHLYDDATAAFLAETIPRARAVRFERSGHAPHMEEPDLFNRTIIDFAASLPGIRDNDDKM